MQGVKGFNGERSKFRGWNDKLVNALAQVTPEYRQAIKFLNKKLETIDGIITDDNPVDILKVMNGRLTADEYNRASADRKQADDAKRMTFVKEESPRSPRRR